jgi:hypothetical protein
MDWEKMRLLKDPQLHAALHRSKSLARQHKPFLAFLLFASFVLFCMHLPWSGAHSPIYGPPSPSSSNYSPHTDPVFNRTIPHGQGSLELIPKIPSGKKARWAKVAVASGFEDVVYEKALETHIRHAKRHGYPMYVGRENAADGMFNKIAFILHIVLQELYKPADERIEWLL